MTDAYTEQLTKAVQYQQAGQFNEAEGLCRAVLAAVPDHLDALQLLAAGRFVRGDFAGAATALETALALHPDNYELTVLAGHSQRSLGAIAPAAAFYAQAVEIRPASAESRVMLGWSLRALDRRAESIAQYEQAIAINPELIEAHNNLGVLYHDNGELERAIPFYRTVLARQPDHIEARRNLAAALRALGRIEEALAEFEALLIYQPDHAYAALMVMHSRRELCRWQDYDAMTTRVREIATTQPGGFSPFILFNWDVPAPLLLQAAAAYAARSIAAAGMVVPAQPRTTGGKIRLGYFSADFRDHVVASVVAEVLELHDRSAFDVVGYSYGPADDGPQKQRIVAACTAFHDIRAISDETAAAKIRADGIDILVDLTAFTGNIRHGIPVRRPAPLQINWLGYPGTSGSPAVDHLVTDPFTVPADAEASYSEKLIRLPGSCQPHDRTRKVGTTKSRSVYGLPEQAFVFCSFNHVQKITRDIFTSWMAILSAVPGSVLWLRADRDEAMANLRKEAAAAGIAPERLIFAPRTPDMADHLARYGAADLALDTFPYNSHTTANDALWLGCPLLTLAGETFAARVAGGILHALELPELVTASLADYRAKAVQLATDNTLFDSLRARTAAAHTAAHFDTARFARHLEAGYRAAWNIRAGGGESRHITITAQGEAVL